MTTVIFLILTAINNITSNALRDSAQTLNSIQSELNYILLSVCLLGIGDTQPYFHFFDLYKHKGLSLAHE